jgi:hypothetical protein
MTGSARNVAEQAVRYNAQEVCSNCGTELDVAMCAYVEMVGVKSLEIEKLAIGQHENRKAGVRPSGHVYARLNLIADIW